MRNRNVFIGLLLALTVFMGCPNLTTDTTEPPPQPAPIGDVAAPTTTGEITFTGTVGNTSTVHWNPATDNVTAQSELQYKVVRTGANPGTGDSINTVALADAVTGDRLVQNWTTSIISATATSLDPSTVYYFAVLVKDAAGNKALYAPVSVTTTGADDSTSPTLGAGITFTGTSDTATIVQWGVANDNVTLVADLQYKVVRTLASGASTAIDEITEIDAITSGAQLIKDWTADITSESANGLTASSNYYFAVAVKDQAGNKALYTPAAVTTGAVADTTAPADVTSLDATPGVSQVTLTWTDPADADFVQAVVTWTPTGGSPAQPLEVSKGTQTATITGLSNGTAYTFTVKTQDAVPNTSAGVTDTATPADTTPPAPGSAINFSGTTASGTTVHWGVATDNVTAQASLQYKLVKATASTAIDTVSEVDAVLGADLVMDWTANTTQKAVTGLTTGNTYYFAVLVKDAVGNKALYAPEDVIIQIIAIGENIPSSGPFSPVDTNEGSAGYGWSTKTWELGAHFNGADLEIAVWSQNATRILLEFYNRKYYSATDAISGLPSPQDGQGHAVYDVWMEKGANNIWRAKITNVLQYEDEGLMYAFRAWGPNWPWDEHWTRGNSTEGYLLDVDADGNRYNPNKVLFDPYGLEMTHDKEDPALAAQSENGAMYGTGGATDSTSHAYSGTITTGGVSIDRRNVDTGRWAPKSYAIVDATSTGTKPNIAQKDAIIYEGHVRGMTMHPSSMHLTTIMSGIDGFSGLQNVPDGYRGTYKGLTYLIPYFKGLGINTIELLPVHETDNDDNPGGSPGGNFWGYMTYSFFAPDRRFSSDKSPGGPTKEFKEMVKAFHDAGLEIYLDVVYNHTGEGGNWDTSKMCAELTSFRGFDNQGYYALVSTDKTSFWETTGCGNNFDSSKEVVRDHIKDSLEYYTTTMGVDGFRFDLAPVLGRDSYPGYGFNSTASLLADIAAMTTTYSVEMIAEAWDIGTYQVGNFPNKWGEWNGRYRDGTRRYLKGTMEGMDYNSYFHGDYDNFNNQGGPHKSVNFIVAHDGFTLADLVSYSGKNNTVGWPFGPSDGGNDNNDSWDSGGDQSLRRQRIRNFWVWQMFSRGVPMIVYGDEFARTQNGNNNPYNIDSVATWNNYEFIGRDSIQTAPPQGTWDPVSTTGWAVMSYTDKIGTDGKTDSKNNLFLFAQAVMNLRKNDPALRQSDYLMGISYTKEDGTTNLGTTDRARMIRINGAGAGGSDYILCVNMWTETVNYTIPTAPSSKEWKRIIDTANWAESNTDSVGGNFWGASAATIAAGLYGVNSWSIVVLKAE